MRCAWNNTQIHGFTWNFCVVVRFDRDKLHNVAANGNIIQMPSDCIAFNECNEMEYEQKCERNAFLQFISFSMEKCDSFFFNCSLCGRPNTVRAPSLVKVVNTRLDEVNVIFSKCNLIKKNSPLSPNLNLLL